MKRVSINGEVRQDENILIVVVSATLKFLLLTKDANISMSHCIEYWV
jgi:hypothetical protein